MEENKGTTVRFFKNIQCHPKARNNNPDGYIWQYDNVYRRYYQTIDQIKHIKPGGSVKEINLDTLYVDYYR